MPGVNISVGVGNGSSVAGAGLFDFPLSLVGDGLRHFCRYDDLATVTHSGGTISQVDDQSGNGFHEVQASALIRPALDTATFSTAAAAFAGTEYFQIDGALATAMPSDNWTLWVVFQADDAAASQGLLAIASTGGYAIDLEGAKFVVRRQAGSLAEDGATDTSKHLLVAQRISGVVHMQLDGIELAVSGSSGVVGTPSGTSFVGALTGSFFKLNGWIFETGAVDRVLTGASAAGTPNTGELLALATYAALRHP